jgi:GH15 family glucan-1,4-alpha-glucosidase
MIDVKEHIYTDDPKVGHVDVRTRIKDAFYFFLGNGLIQAAVQIAPSGEGSPFGLVFMNPEKLKPKRESISFDPDDGFANTMIRLYNESNKQLVQPIDVKAEWSKINGVPAVSIHWSTDEISINEILYCSDLESPKLNREIRIKNKSWESREFTLCTGMLKTKIEKKIYLPPGKIVKFYIEYTFDENKNCIDLSFVSNAAPTTEAIQYWKNAANMSSANQMLNNYFDASRFQLHAAVSKNGVVDASIWQYNREWVRDHSFMTIGLILSGEFELAKVLLERLITDFVSNEGDCIDSSEIRHSDEVELDQNGTLIYTIKTYVLWTGDIELVKKYWDKIVKIVEFPLKEVFRHKESGMFFNSREYWERHSLYGIKPGIELMYQVFPSIGLNSAATLARLVNKNERAEIWDKEAARLKKAILTHPKFSLVDKRGFIKRLDIDGTVQETITPAEDAGLPQGVPLADNINHLLNPDTCTAMPIVYGFVPADSDVAKATLQNLETIWNQRWDDGGYGRYHFASEPDSHGAWPFASLFLARAYVETGEFEKVWKILDWLNTIPGAISGSWFEMYGPRISPPYAQVGITPWTWGEMIMLFVSHILGIQPEEENIRIRPRLFNGLKNIEGNLPVRKNRLIFKYTVDPKQSKTNFDVNVPVLESNNGEILIPYSNKDINVKVVFPEK